MSSSNSTKIDGTGSLARVEAEQNLTSSTRMNFQQLTGEQVQRYEVE